MPTQVYDAFDNGPHQKTGWIGVRSRKTPNVPIEAGYQHLSLQTIMNAAKQNGSRVTLMPKRQEVMAGGKVFKY
jgi:hypothetical protein